MTQFRPTLVAILLLTVNVARADGPADNIPEKVRPRSGGGGGGSRGSQGEA